MEHGDPNAGGGGGQELIWEEVAAENGEKKEAKADLPGQKVEKEMALEAEKIVKSSPPSADGVARMEKQKEAVESEQQPKMGPTVDGQQAKETETPTTTWSEELSMEPRKRVRLVEAGGDGDGEKKAAESGEAEKEPEKEKEEEEPVATERKSCVKDENGFTYYKCRFCGLTFNYMTTLKAHERVHNIDAPYTCNKCGEAFHYMCELEYHAKTHLAQKGYKCECGRTFYQYTDLLYHRHPGDDPEPSFPLPASAPVQPILLPSSSQPAIHASDFPTPEFAELGFEPKHQMRVWSDVRSKPYICQYCSKSYSDSRGLAYHMYSHRGERMFNPRASRYLMCRNDNSYISSGLDLKDA